MAELVSLAEHDAVRRRKWQRKMGDATPNAPNGVACPNCGTELRDGYPVHVGNGYMPFVAVGCPNCDWRGERVR